MEKQLKKSVSVFILSIFVATQILAAAPSRSDAAATMKVSVDSMKQLFAAKGKMGVKIVDGNGKELSADDLLNNQNMVNDGAAKIDYFATKEGDDKAYRVVIEPNAKQDTIDITLAYYKNDLSTLLASTTLSLTANDNDKTLKNKVVGAVSSLEDQYKNGSFSFLKNLRDFLFEPAYGVSDHAIDQIVGLVCIVLGLGTLSLILQCNKLQGGLRAGCGLLLALGGLIALTIGGTRLGK